MARIRTILPTAIDLLNAISQNLIVNAKEGLNPYLDTISLKSRALDVVNEDTIIYVADTRVNAE